MPRKLTRPDTLHPRAQERLRLWGLAIRAQRLRYQELANNLARRLDISVATLRRMEHGDPAVSAASYLNALQTLGLLDLVVPPPTIDLTTATLNQRVSRTSATANEIGDDDFF